MYTGWCAIYVFLRSSTVFHILICFLIVLHITEIINIYLCCISPVPPHSILFYCVYYLSVVKMWQHPYYTNPQVTKKHETTGSDRFSIALPFSKIILSHESWFKQHIILIFVHLKQRRSVLVSRLWFLSKTNKKCVQFTELLQLWCQWDWRSQLGSLVPCKSPNLPQNWKCNAEIFFLNSRKLLV